MINRLRQRFAFWLERQLVKGAQYRLLLVVAAVGVISIVGGGLVSAWGTGFEDLPGAIWWAFLRLTDPGYLGDDVGMVNRTVSTLLTVLGYVVFLGALVAIMTQWLDARMRMLEMGLTPIARNGHMLVLGWTNRTPAMIKELLVSKGRVRRFLRRHGARSLHIVLLADDVDAELVQELRDGCDEDWDEGAVTVRSGNAIRIDHLERVDFRNASRIIIPGSEFKPGGPENVDTHTIKALLSLSSDPDGDGERELPLAVAEVFNPGNIRIARRAYRGDLEVIASDAVISRLLAQNVRHRGLSLVFNELLTLGAGNEIYIRDHPKLVGVRFQDVAPIFPRAIPLGVIRRQGRSLRPYLNPAAGYVIGETDEIALLAHEYDDSTPQLDNEPASVERGEPTPPTTPGAARRVLLCGWNHRVPQLIREFGTYANESFEIDILSTVSAANRKKALARVRHQPERITLGHIEADYSLHHELRAAEPESYDTVVVLGSDRHKTEEESDARTMLGYLGLQELLPEDARTGLIVELLDPNNVPLLGRTHGEVLISPLILSHILALVALRHELRSVLDELFTAGGAEICFRPVPDYGLSGQNISFADVRRAANAVGETALGVRTGLHAAELHLNPPAESLWTVGPGLDVVTLTTYGPAEK